MFDTPITVVGNVVTKVDRRRVGDQELMKFRIASNSRRRTSEGTWEPGNTFYATVNCWGKLVAGVGAALGIGDPVIVVGYVYTSEYDDRDGNRRSSVEIRATSVGPDLARCYARIESRRSPAGRDERADEADEASAEEAGTTGADESVVEGEAVPVSA